MVQVLLKFAECEHSGDLEQYVAVVRGLGAKVVERRVDVNAEEGTLVVQVPDMGAFLRALRPTDAAEMLIGFRRL